MGWGGRSCVVLVVAAACGPSAGEPDGSGEAGGSTSTMDPSADVDTGAAETTSGVTSSAEGGVSVDSSTDGSGSSSSDLESTSTTGDWPACECASDETCVELVGDNCGLEYDPNLSCVETPVACVGREPACDDECGWEICGGPNCIGLHASVCTFVESVGFVCGSAYCNIFTQDCSFSATCTSFDADSDGAFDTTICAGRDSPTVAVGEPCEGRHNLNGYDNCEPGSMCVGDDATAATGICRAPCIGNPWNATCADPTMQCVLDEWFFAWCLPA